MGSNTSSLVIDRLCAKTRGEDIAIAMFYCDFHHNQEQTSTDIMGAILKQLMVRREVQKLVQKAFQRARVESGSRGRPLPDMMTNSLRADILRIILEKIAEMHVGASGVPFN